MFEEFHDLPVHALSVHASVVLVPLSALLAVLFAIPRFHAWAEWAFPLVTLAATGAVFVSRQSGAKLEETLGVGPPGEGNARDDVLADHADAGKLLFLMMLGFALIALVAFVLSRRNLLGNQSLQIAVSIVLVVSAGVVAYQTYRVGELGSKAVWNPDGSIDYKSITLVQR